LREIYWQVFIFAKADRNLGIQTIVEFLQNEPKVPSKHDIGEQSPEFLFGARQPHVSHFRESS
jgi:hypothetical protein